MAERSITLGQKTPPGIREAFLFPHRTAPWRAAFALFAQTLRACPRMPLGVIQGEWVNAWCGIEARTATP